MTTPRSPLDALKPAAGRLLERALNRALELDPETRSGLQALNGQRVQLHLESPLLAMEIAVEGERLRIGPAQGDEPDLSIKAGIGALLGQLPFLKGAGSTPVGKVRLNGDAELARQLQRLAENFDPDWDKPFADLLGPVIGPQVAKTLREALKTARVQAGNLAQQAAEYLSEETGDIVPKAELEAFHEDVDALRDRAERIAARVARLSPEGLRE